MKQFTNYSNTDFTCTWDGKEYIFLPNESRILEDGVVEAFAKHLANKKFSGTLVAEDQTFKEEMSKAISEVDTSIKVKPEVVVEAIFEDIEKEEEEKPKQVKKTPKRTSKAKAGRKPKVKTTKDEEAFEGLQDIK